VMNAVRAGNRYLEQRAPWTLAKNGDIDGLNTVLFSAADALRQLAALLAPVMPDKMAELRRALGYTDAAMPKIAELNSPADSPAGRAIVDIPPLFMRIAVEEAEKPAKTEPKKSEKAAKKAAAPVEAAPGVITIEDFSKVSLRTAKVLAAERVEGSDKLLKLQIELGAEKRQLVAGIAQSYAPEEVVGKTIIVVANLKPAKIRGVESQGMLLAAKADGKLALLTAEGMPSGAVVG